MSSLKVIQEVRIYVRAPFCAPLFLYELAWEFQRKGVGRQVSGLTTRDQATIFSTQLAERRASKGSERMAGGICGEFGMCGAFCVRALAGPAML